jgi:hypothetical protein
MLREAWPSCERCGKPFRPREYQGGGACPKRFCSKKCQQAAWAAQQRAQRAAPVRRPLRAPAERERAADVEKAFVRYLGPPVPDLSAGACVGHPTLSPDAWAADPHSAQGHAAQQACLTPMPGT